jgi:hypothetical protein
MALENGRSEPIDQNRRTRTFNKVLDGLAIAAGVSIPILVGGAATFFGYGLVYSLGVITLLVVLALWARTRYQR